ncbi:MAG: hypothetical protein U1F43_06060 [Myxococcota bacterium]
MDRPRLMGPSVAARLVAALVATLGACASSPDTAGHGNPEVRHAAAWFGIKTPDCKAALPAVAAAATKPGGTAPTPMLMRVGPDWCAFEPQEKGPPTRADSVAQTVSATLGLPTVSFWATADAWSYGIFDRGQSVYAMESHYGAPMLIGDEARAAAIVGLPTGALYGYLSSARQPDVADALASRIGAARPIPGSPLADFPVAAPSTTYDPKAHPPSPRLEAGAWAVLPPLGVVLVKEVTAEGNYVLVDDDRTFPIPIERAGGLGMRRLASPDDVALALKRVEDGTEVKDAKEYSAERAQRWLDALKNGDLQGIAKTYAEICAVQSERKLFAVEQGLLATSREWLAEEIGTVQNKPTDALESVLDDACD